MINMDKIPVEYRPLSARKYLLYTILFAIPIIGLIFIVIYSLSNSNINRKNFAKAYLFIYAFLLIAFVIFGLSGGFAYVIGLLKG